MEIPVQHGTVGPAGGVFMYVTATVGDDFPLQSDGGPTVEEVIGAVELKTKELGFIEVTQVREYIHNNIFKVAVLAIHPTSFEHAVIHRKIYVIIINTLFFKTLDLNYFF